MRFVAVARTVQCGKQRLLVDVSTRAKPRALKDRTQPSGFARDRAEDRFARISLRATLCDFVRKNPCQHATHDHSVLAGPHELVQWNCLQELHERTVRKRIRYFDS